MTLRESLKGASGKGGKGKGRGGNGGADGMRGNKKNEGMCYEFQKTGKCRFGPNCKYKHVPNTSNIRLTKAQKKKARKEANLQIQHSLLYGVSLDNVHHFYIH